jgi:hypothetical protein
MTTALKISKMPLNVRDAWSFSKIKKDSPKGLIVQSDKREEIWAEDKNKGFLSRGLSWESRKLSYSTRPLRPWILTVSAWCKIQYKNWRHITSKTNQQSSLLLIDFQQWWMQIESSWWRVDKSLKWARINNWEHRKAITTNSSKNNSVIIQSWAQVQFDSQIKLAHNDSLPSILSYIVILHK